MGVSLSTKKPAIQGGTITIQTDKTLYSPGDTVTGTIFLNIFTSQPSAILSLTFHGFEVWSAVIQTDKGTYLREKKHKIIQTKWRLCKWENGLQAEHIEVPFSFVLPSNIPASFHQERTKFLAHITYRLEVALKPKRRPVILQYKKLMIRRPLTTVPIGYSEEKTVPLKMWYVIPRGSITIKAHFEKNVYAERETARVAIEIDCSSGKIPCANLFFHLKQRVTLHDTTNKRVFDTTTVSNMAHGFPPKSGPRREVLFFTIPPFYGDEHDLDTRKSLWPRYSPGGLCLTTKGKIITSEFFLEISCQMKGYKTSTPKLRCPIQFAYPCPRSPDILLPINWYPHVTPKAELGPALSSKRERKVNQSQRDARLKMMETELVMEENRSLAPSNDMNGLSLAGRQI